MSIVEIIVFILGLMCLGAAGGCLVLGFDDAGVGGIIFGLLSAALMGLIAWVLIASATGIKDYFGEDDPCTYVIMAGKVPIVMHHHGPTEYGGRIVLCPE